MKHRPTGFVLNTLANEVPGGAALVEEVRKTPEVLRVEPTQLKFMDKFGLIDHHGALMTLAGSSIRIELAK